MKKLGIFFILVAMILSFQTFTNHATAAEDFGNHLFLHTGSPLILKGKQISAIDTENPDVAATIINSRTLLPLRAISEHFGAQVSYDAKNKVAIIEYQETKYLFPIDHKSYTIETKGKSTTITLDSNSTIINNRTMVPLRVLAEDVFKKDVSYFDQVIAVGDTTIDLKAKTDLLEQVKAKIGVALKAQSLEEVKEAVLGSSYYYLYKDGMLDFKGDLPAEAPEMSENSSMADRGSNTFSETNTQVEGIDEADLVKTDGKNIYIVAQNAVRIIKADKENLAEIAVLLLEKDKIAQEIFVDHNRLVILGTRYKYLWENSGYQIKEDNMFSMIRPPFYSSKNYTFIDVYDIKDPSAPFKVKSHEIEGNYSTSRKKGDIVYLVTNTYVFGDIYLPLVRDTATGFTFKEIELKDVMVMPRFPSEGFVGVSALDITNNEKAEVELITANGSTTYMNDHALYIASTDYNGFTSITKFTLNGLKVGYAGSGKVEGYLINQFALDEHEGYLRVGTTEWSGFNNLFVLDSSLNITGTVANLAPGESIYSVRFLGDKGYIVTFRTIDPLFVFDLSDPTNPVVTGELKIPGFSSYLHPLSDTHLLGLGMDVVDVYQKDKEGKETVVGQRQGGIKISLFDVSDMGKPKEVSNYIIGDSGSYTESLSNHKAIMFDNNKNLFAFDAHLTDSPYNYQSESGAVLISYANNEITVKNILYSTVSNVYGEDIPSASRIIFIDDILYYIKGSKVIAYDYDDFTELSTLYILPQ